MNAIWYLTALDVARRIRAGELTSVQVTETLLARVADLDPRLHSYARVTGEHALAQARAADVEISAGKVRGPLHGVPIAVKDLCDTRGIITSAGMPLRRAHVPAADATVVARLQQAGTVLLGKLQMTEGAFSAHHPDIAAPVNPWGSGYWSGVSSSGSGVATASGLCFGSLGSDTLGSIRFPSTMNGITGLKPTWGRVSRAGVFPLAQSMDHVGPMTRSAADAAAMLQVIAGSDAADPTAAQVAVPDYLNALHTGVAGLRVGIDRQAISAIADADTAAATEEAITVLARLGATIHEVSLPDLLPVAQDALTHCLAETAVTHEPTFGSQPEAYGPVLASLIQAGRRVDAASLVKIGYRRAEFTGRVNALFDTVDLLLLPAMNRAASTLADLEKQVTDLGARHARLAFTAPFDMSRHPTLTLPGGATARGLPVGFQIIGAHFDEGRILAAGHAFQQATDWHQRHPLV